MRDLPNPRVVLDQDRRELPLAHRHGQPGRPWQDAGRFRLEAVGARREGNAEAAVSIGLEAGHEAPRAVADGDGGLVGTVGTRAVDALDRTGRPGHGLALDAADAATGAFPGEQRTGVWAALHAGRAVEPGRRTVGEG